MPATIFIVLLAVLGGGLGSERIKATWIIELKECSI